MDILLIAVTGVSLSLALGMGALVLRLVREDRRRSEARVAALIDMASGEGQAAAREDPAIQAPPAAPHAPRLAVAPVAAGGTRATPDVNRHTAQPQRPAPAAPVREREIDLDLRPASIVSLAGVGDLFVQPARRSPWGTRLTVAAGLAAAVTIAGYLLLSSGARPVPGSGGAAAPAAASTVAPLEPLRTRNLTPRVKFPGSPVTAAGRGPRGAGGPLELLSLRHTRQDSGLAVTGLVQNPRGGATLIRVIATAVALGADGTVLASAAAPLDFTSLAPGAESPFVVQIPAKGDVARYRIGFRAEDGGVIAHIDRRTAEAIARR